jgi:GNAT superfamily N-acetyltransferase
MTARLPLEVQDAREALVDDAALQSLMCGVYVNEGFTSPEVAATVLSAAAIRRRGRLLFVRDFADQTLSGAIIVVAPGSPACRVARDGEAEMQLLAVSAKRRNGGVGGALVEAAVRLARSDGYSRMVLRTQPTMHSAHRLYARAGFVRAPERDLQDHGRMFLVYQMPL